MPNMGQTTKPLVRIASPTECWEWIGSINKITGYGKKQFNGKTILAHRWVYESLLGSIGENMVVNHICSNPCCVNPTHLESVTQAENCRHGKGSKLTKVQAKTIKRLKPYKCKGLKRALANRYNVSCALISDIWYGRAWKDV